MQPLQQYPPQATPQVHVHLAQPNPYPYPGFQPGAAPVIASGAQQWTTGLCGCFSDCGICCYGAWCAPCLYGDNVARVTGGGCCGACMLYSCFPWCVICCCAPDNRRQLRKKYNLAEDPCSDCCTHFWCSCLAVCQEGREIKMRGA